MVNSCVPQSSSRTCASGSACIPRSRPTRDLLHDDRNLGLVYEVLRFDPAASPAQRERRVAEAKARYATLLKRFAAGSADNLSAHEQRILHAFGDAAAPG